jgi:hypothetical protein
MAGHHPGIVPLGRVLVLLLLCFALAGLTAQGMLLASLLSLEQGGTQGTIAFVPANVLSSAVLLLVVAASVVLIRRQFLKEKKQAEPVPLPLEPERTARIKHFLSRFLPGLAHLRLSMSDRSSYVSRDTLFLSLRVLGPLERMASRIAGASNAVDSSDHAQERAAFAILAHEEFHQLCFDSKFDAGFRAVCFVQILAQAPFLLQVLLAPSPAVGTVWIFLFLAPLWLPLLMWLLLWSAHGGTHLLEHLADSYAVQRLGPASASASAAWDSKLTVPASSTPSYIDSRAHHPSIPERLGFIHTRESKAVVRLMLFQFATLFTLSAQIGVHVEVQFQGGISYLGPLYTLAVIASAVLCLLFSGIIGALVPVRYMLLSSAACLLLFLGYYNLAAAAELGLSTPWLLLCLTPFAGQLLSRLLVRNSLLEVLQAASPSVPPLPTSTDGRESGETLRLALSLESSTPKPRSQSQRFFAGIHTYGRFFDAVMGMGFAILIVVTIAGFIPRAWPNIVPLFMAFLSIAYGCIALLFYFKRWSERRVGIVLLWCARMATLVFIVPTAALMLNLYLYAELLRSALCPPGAVNLEMCLGQIMMDREQIKQHMNGLIEMILTRCVASGTFDEPTLLAMSPSEVLLALFLCSFIIPDRSLGPALLICIGVAVLFDTVLSFLRWLGAKPRPLPPPQGKSQ